MSLLFGLDELGTELDSSPLSSLSVPEEVVGDFTLALALAATWAWFWEEGLA